MSAAIPGMTAAAFRSHFPPLRRQAHFAACSLGARSRELREALDRMVRVMDTEGAPWPAFEHEVDRTRCQVAALLGASPSALALVPNASVGAYQVASGIDWGRRNKIVTSRAEFPSIAHVWLAQKQRGAHVLFVEDSTDPEEMLSRYVAAIDERTAVVSAPAVTYLYGLRLSVARIARAAHALGARLFTDAYQALGAEPIDVEALGCDYLVAGAMKYLTGLPGIAFLYVRTPESLEQPPSLTGWFGRREPFAFDPALLDWAPDARRFETGTLSIPAVYAAAASASLIARLDLTAVRHDITALARRAVARLGQQGERLQVASDASGQGAHVGLYDEAPLRLAEFLAERRIVVSPRGPVVRLAFHFYNNAEDVDRLCDCVRQYRLAMSAYRRIFPVLRPTNIRTGGVMFDHTRVVKPAVAALSRTIIRAELAVRPNYLRLDKNENFEPLPSAALEELRGAFSQQLLSGYPDLSRVYRKVADLARVDEDQIFIAAGSDLALKALYDACIEPGDEVVVHTPFYFMHEIHARQAGARLAAVPITGDWLPDVNGMLRAITPHTKMMVVEDPSGFMGTRLGWEEMRQLAHELAERSVLLVIDEAYLYVAADASRNLVLLEQMDNVVISRTLSKAHGLAGARVGFVIAAPALAREISKVRPLYELSALNAWVAEWHLDHPELLAGYRASLAKQKAIIAVRLSGLNVEVRDTPANFFLMRIAGQDSTAVAEAFRRHGILVRRPFDDRLLSGWTRVTVPPACETEHFLGAAAEICETLAKRKVA